MKNMGLEGDENDNYEELIGPGKLLRCSAGDFLKEIGEKISEYRMFLNDIMFLSDVGIDGSRTTLSCLYGSFHLGCLFGDEKGARLFLK